MFRKKKNKRNLENYNCKYEWTRENRSLVRLSEYFGKKVFHCYEDKDSVSIRADKMVKSISALRHVLKKIIKLEYIDLKALYKNNDEFKEDVDKSLNNTVFYGCISKENVYRDLFYISDRFLSLERLNWMYFLPERYSKINHIYLNDDLISSLKVNGYYEINYVSEIIKVSKIIKVDENNIYLESGDNILKSKYLEQYVYGYIPEIILGEYYGEYYSGDHVIFDESEFLELLENTINKKERHRNKEKV